MYSFGYFSKAKAALGLACVALLATDALASTHPRRSVAAMLESSHLVFDGTVVSIEHRASDIVVPGDRALPHTFVTFRIDALVKGSSQDGSTITLRFLGGPDGTGRHLTVAGVPQFRVGDRDVLFVNPNDDKLCPIVDWEHGRLRIVRGDAFTALGGELWITPEGSLVHGPAKLDLASPVYAALGVETAKANHSCEAHDAESFEPAAGAMRVDAQGLVAVLRHHWNVLRAAKALAEPAPVKSARLGDPLPMPFRVVRPRTIPAKAAPKVERGRNPDLEPAH